MSDQETENRILRRMCRIRPVLLAVPLSTMNFRSFGVETLPYLLLSPPPKGTLKWNPARFRHKPAVERERSFLEATDKTGREEEGRDRYDKKGTGEDWG